MTNPQRSTRGAGNETERERHIASAETVGFATTAATMLLGLVAGAEAREHAAQSANQPPPAGPQSPAQAPALPSQVQGDTSSGHEAATAAHAAHETTPAGPAAVTPVVHHATSDADVHAVGSGAAAASGVSPIIEHHSAAASADHTALHAPAIAPPALTADAGSATQHHDTVQQATLLDGALTNLSQIGETVSATLQQVTDTLASDAAHLSGSLSAMTAALTSSLSGVADPMHPAGTSEPLAPIAGVDALHLDTAGAVPVAFVQAAPLHLGFIGQPTADGHDTHDGAFSALGAHHF